MPTYRAIYLEKDEPARQPTLEDLLRPEGEEALTIADFVCLPNLDERLNTDKSVCATPNLPMARSSALAL